MDDHRRLHIVMFPWLAFGHMIPFLELSKALARRGHLISFLSTPRNIKRLPKIPPNLSPLIHLVQLPLPPVDELQESDAESTMDLPPDKIQYLKKAFDRLEGPFSDFLEKASPAPDWVVLDFAQYWIPRVASAAGVPCAFFSVFNAWIHGFFGPLAAMTGCGGGGEDSWTRPEQLLAPSKWIPFPSKVAFRLHEAQLMTSVFDRNASGVSDFYRLGSAIQGCRVFTLRSSVELDPEMLGLIQEHYGIPVVPVGMLPPQLAEEPSDSAATEKGEIHDWLDKQAPWSVVYVAFGSEASLSPELMHEFALGLELSGLPFLWALRKPPGSPDDVELLPPGFEDRIKGRGLVATGWVPQTRVLSHTSVGGFLTHSGWSSVIEGLAFGKPLVFLPFFGDQGLIAQQMEERKVGLEIPRDEKDGSFTRDGVARSLKLVMAEDDEKTGEQHFRANARRVASEIFGNRARHDRYVDDFVQCLMNGS